MADKTTIETTINIGFKYQASILETDIKKIFLKLPNPKNDLTESQIRTAAVTALALLKTPEGGEMTNTSIFTAYKEDVEETEYDIGVTN